MLKIKKLLKILYKNPMRLLAFFFIQIMPNNFVKKKIFSSKLINKKLFLISFDCDTQKDIDALEILTQKLNNIDIKIVLAIPAELVKKNKDLITNLNNKHQIEFINHGYYLHTEFNQNNKEYKPIFSYDKKSIDFIKEDIQLAHFFFNKEMNINLTGFRAPHFGDINFEKKKKIFEFLKGIGYSYSSSSIYDLAFFNGPIFKSNGITELTVTGCPDNPISMLDSWSYLIKENDKICLSSSYFKELKKMSKIIVDNEYNFINIYADPSHVIYNDEFFDIIKTFSKFNSLNFKDLNIT